MPDESERSIALRKVSSATRLGRIIAVIVMKTFYMRSGMNSNMSSWMLSMRDSQGIPRYSL